MTEKSNFRAVIRDELRKDYEKHRQFQSIANYVIQFFLTLGALFVSWKLQDPTSVNTAQSRYTERKIDAYLGVTQRLTDGWNPHGLEPNTAVLPIYSSLDTFVAWWRGVDNFYSQNAILFDDSSKTLYMPMNVETLRQMKAMSLSPSIDSLMKREFKYALVEKIEPLFLWFTKYLNEKYGTENGVRR